MTNGNKIIALCVLLFLSIAVLPSCQTNKNTAVLVSEEINVQDADMDGTDEETDDISFEETDADYSGDLAVSETLDRFFKVSRKDNNYILTLFDNTGKVVKEEECPRQPVIKILEDKILEIVITMGSQSNYIHFYDTKTGRVSPFYDNPSAIGKDKIAYFKDGVLVISDMFNKSVFYKEIKRNFAQTTVPATLISEAKFQETDIFTFRYMEGTEFKAVTEVINLSESEDRASAASEPSITTKPNDTLVLIQNETVKKDKLKRENSVKADFLDIKEFNRIADFKTADINGDKVDDFIIAIAQNTQPVGGGINYGDFKIILQDGKTKEIALLDNKFTDNLSGFGITLLTGNFDDDKVSDLFIYVNMGGNGGAGSHIHKIITFKNNTPLAMLGETRDSMQVEAKGKFEDGYKFLIRYDPIYYQYAVDVSAKKDKYKDLYSDGKVKVQEPYSLGSIEYFYELIPKDTDDDGVLELLGSQYISGNGRSDTIGTLRSLLKWDDVLKKYKVLKLFYIEDFSWDEEWYEIN